jgi:hypothetical protein
MGATFTCVMVTEAVLLQPFTSLYVIVAVPPATPVTSPVDETVAMDVFEDVHGLVAAGVPDPVS